MDADDNLALSIQAAQRETSGQLTLASALDAKLMGLLAFMSAAAGILLTSAHGLASDRLILLIGAVVSSALALLGVLGGGDPKTGPDPLAFYEAFGGGGSREFAEQLLADLGKSIDENRSLIERRSSTLSSSFALAVLAAVIFGLVRAFNSL